MKIIKLILLIFIFIAGSCAEEKKTNIEQITAKEKLLDKEYLIAVLDTIWRTEQEPLQARDEMMNKHGIESEQAKKYQKIYKKNHVINEKKIIDMLDTHGWPGEGLIGEQGSLTICNVIQHSDNQIRLKYLPMMKEAVKAKKLQPRLLVRAEDRIATEAGNLQIYGGQMKYYPETKTFNVWPVYDPINIDKRRAEIGLGPIADYLKDRFDFEWNLEEQIKRSAAFEKERLKNE